MTENTYNFDDYKIQDVFYQFYTSGKTGVIKVFFPLNIVKTVYFSEGNIVFATSNSEKDKLTNILIKNKKITKEQLNMALKQMDKSISLGRNLVNMGLITHKELVWAVKIQVLSIVYSILMLKEGEYSVVEGFLPEGIIKLPFNTLKILFDSLLLFKDKDWISEQILPDMVFVKTNFFDEYKEKILPDSSYEKIYDLIDGSRTVSEITEMVDIEDFKVYKLFYALKFLKLIEEKVEGIASFEIDEEETGVEEESMYEVKGDDTENIKMVEELIGAEDKTKDVAIEFEGGVSEHSAFEEDLESQFNTDEQVSGDDKEMGSIVLDESDFEEESKDEEAEDFKETVARDKSEYLEQLQKELEEESSIVEEIEQDNFKLEFEEEKEEQTEKTVPVSSPYETARQEIKPEFSTPGMVDENEDSFVVEEEYVKTEKSSMGLYITLILILFIVALGYLGYNYYSESKAKTKSGYTRPEETVKTVKKSNDITTEDITLNKIEEKLDGKTVTESQVPEEEAKVDSSTKEIQTTETTNKEDNSLEATVTYEAVPVYENETKSDNVSSSKQSKKVAVSNGVDRESYNEFILNSKNILIANPESYTIQLELACQKETLDRAIELLREKDMIFFIPTKFRGNTCFIICYGIYNTMDEAKVAMEALDAEFFKDNTPLIKQASKFNKFF